MSNSFSNQTLAQIDLWAHKDTHENTVYHLPKKLDEEVASLHLDQIGVQLTKLSECRAPQGARVRSCFAPSARRNGARRVPFYAVPIHRLGAVESVLVVAQFPQGLL